MYYRNYKHENGRWYVWCGIQWELCREGFDPRERDPRDR